MSLDTKIACGVFGSVVVLLAIIIFGSMGLSTLIRRLGWLPDCLFFAALMFILAGLICMTAFAFGKRTDRNVEARIVNK